MERWILLLILYLHIFVLIENKIENGAMNLIVNIDASLYQLRKDKGVIFY